MGCLCRKFREEPLARPASLRNGAPVTYIPVAQTRGFPRPRPLCIGRGSRFGEWHAPALPPVSSARNTIETVFCPRRNHISASALNPTSQQMTNGRRVPAERALRIPGGQERKLL